MKDCETKVGQAAAGNGVEALVHIAFPGNGIPQLRLALEEGFFKKFIFTDSMKSVELIDTIGAGNYGVFGTAVETIATASEDLFRDAYEIEFGDVPLLPFAGNAYDATFLMALAIQKAGSTDRTAIRDALCSVAGGGGLPILPGEWTKAVAALSAGQHINYQGAAGSQDFDANGDVPGTIGVWTITDGDFQTLEFRGCSKAKGVMRSLCVQTDRPGSRLTVRRPRSHFRGHPIWTAQRIPRQSRRRCR